MAYSRLALMGLLPALAVAETEEPAPTILPPVVVTATRDAEPETNVPNSVSIIGGDEIRENLVRTLPEAFERTPGVMVQKTAHGQGSPFIRGFTGFRNLLLVDGIRLNHAGFREGPNQYWATVDPLMASRPMSHYPPGGVRLGSELLVSGTGWVALPLLCP